jgi:hypothetical protein
LATTAQHHPALSCQYNGVGVFNASCFPPWRPTLPCFFHSGMDGGTLVMRWDGDKVRGETVMTVTG